MPTLPGHASFARDSLSGFVFSARILAVGLVFKIAFSETAGGLFPKRRTAADSQRLDVDEQRFLEAGVIRLHDRA
jgi:hypothetical protein